LRLCLGLRGCLFQSGLHRHEWRWEDSNLRGTVHAGPRSLDISKGSFKPETGAIILEFDAQANGRTVHYAVDGKVEGNRITGTWSRDDQKGDFQVTKQ